MTPQEIDKECDAIENKFIDFGMTYEEINKCAIRYQTGIVESCSLFQHNYGSLFGNKEFIELTEAKEILERLKSRI